MLNIAEESGSAGIEFIARSMIEAACPELVTKVLVHKVLVHKAQSRKNRPEPETSFRTFKLSVFNLIIF